MKLKVRLPSQKRGIKTKNKMIDSAIRLFSEFGYHKTTTKMIAEDSGVAIGSFYAYFKNKKSIFIAALTEHDRQVTEEIVTSLSENQKIIEDKRKFLYKVIDILIRAHEICTGFHREIEFMQYSDPEIREWIEKQQKESIRIAFESINYHRNDLRVQDVETASVLVYSVMEQIIHLIVFSPDYREDKDKLIDHLVDMVYRYLYPD